MKPYDQARYIFLGLFLFLLGIVLFFVVRPRSYKAPFVLTESTVTNGQRRVTIALTNKGSGTFSTSGYTVLLGIEYETPAGWTNQSVGFISRSSFGWISPMGAVSNTFDLPHDAMRVRMNCIWGTTGVRNRCIAWPFDSGWGNSPLTRVVSWPAVVASAETMEFESGEVEL